MAGGITPKAQPLDVLLNKLFKGAFRNFYDFYMLNAKTNNKGHTIPPSRQLLAQWVVAAWESISEDLVAKSWKCCGYKSLDDLINDKAQTSDIVVAQ